ncbi:MAG: hypothetical protein JSR24_19995 [Proteobacteria bacterium]|nr:hypothetical protein [Pseudomonadota bacterium]
MLRYSLLLGAGLAAVATAAVAQPRKQTREDLLDALTTHIQICAEINDQQARLACYDKLQTKVGDVQAPAPSPTPLRPASPTPPPASSGGSMQATPLTPPPMTVPGGGVAALGGQGQPGTLAPPPGNPDAAFDTRDATSSYRPPEGAMPKPQPPVRRTGPRPVPNFSTPVSLVTLTATNLTYGEARYWQVSISITSNTPRTLTTQIQCTFLNAGRPVGDAYFGPTDIAAGEQISTELIGPPTTVFVDSTSCRVLSP